jgi:hypothetical protein
MRVLRKKKKKVSRKERKKQTNKQTKQPQRNSMAGVSDSQVNV